MALPNAPEILRGWALLFALFRLNLSLNHSADKDAKYEIRDRFTESNVDGDDELLLVNRE